MSETARSETDWNEMLRDQGLVADGEHSRLREPTAPTRPAVAALSHLSALSVTGDDAEAFLDGQLSAAIRELPSGEAVLTAWHDPKGRARTLFHVLRDGDGFRLLMPRTLVGPVLPKLRMYVLRARVTINDETTHWPALGLIQSEPSRQVGWCPLSGANQFHYFAGPEPEARALWSQALSAGHQALGSSEWRWLEMRAGIPGLPVGASELFLPQFLDLTRFGGLNFRKGCYIGQEVIARTHYLGKVKQGLQLATASAPVLAGTAVRNADEQKIGHVLDAVPDAADTGQWLVQLVIRGDRVDGHLYADQETRPELRLIEQDKSE